MLGCRVSANTRSHVLPLEFIDLGEVATSSGIGRKTIRLLHKPTENPVNPAMAVARVEAKVVLVTSRESS